MELGLLIVAVTLFTLQSARYVELLSPLARLHW